MFTLQKANISAGGENSEGFRITPVFQPCSPALQVTGGTGGEPNRSDPSGSCQASVKVRVPA